MNPLPPMPPGFERLAEVAQNLWWSWQSEARELFRTLDETLWRRTRHNPIRLLREIDPERLERATQDPEVRRRYQAVLNAFDEAIRGRSHWCAEHYPKLADSRVAFLSAEYGLHTSLPLYAGGLGVLAGDIAKEASDLGLPFVGVGFMYPQGYFRQHVNPEGRQEEVSERIDREQVPVEPVRDLSGAPFRITLTLPDRSLQIAAWKVRIGRGILFLMDTDLDENAPGDRELTGRLYGGDQNARFLQETILGIGGVRVLRALSIRPEVWHGNEGHTALMMVERLRERLAQGIEFDRAVEDVRATTVFTTHTPVAAGHDAFPFDLVRHYLGRLDQYGEAMEAHRDRLFSLGSYSTPWGTGFHMTALAMRLSGHVNAVSRKHGEVSRAMWAALWPGTPPERVPIRSITNGVHVPTWIGGEMDRLLRAKLDKNWIARQDDASLWDRLSRIPDEALWEARRNLKTRLFHFIHDRVRERWAAHDLEAGQAVALGSLLDPEALTIGFARRFASYKRATLMLRDRDRLRSLLDDPRRPVQIIFAGKAHPADGAGKDLLQEIYRAAREPALAGRIAFIEDYDMHAAHWLVQGVDLWLNNPRAPLEACGTSGMKAGINGVPSLSVLDGWWIEAYDGGNGWAVPGGPDGEEGDARDFEDLYRILEQQIVPLYYERHLDGVPRGWLRVVRHAIQTIAPAFSARRMVKEYVETMYAPAALEAERRAL
jgi:glycogen phosphorylase